MLTELVVHEGEFGDVSGSREVRNAGLAEVSESSVP